MFALQEFYASSGLTQTILCDTSSNGTYVREPADGSEYKFVGAGRNHLLVNNARIAIKHSNANAGYGDFEDLFMYVETPNDLGTARLRKSFVLTNHLLGKGASGQVYMAQERMTCMPMALKIVAKSAHSFAVNGKSDELKKLRNEMTILRQLAHPCVIQYMDSDEDSRSLYIVMEYAAHGEFFDFITDLRFNGKGIGEALSLFYAYQLVTAIEYIHSRKVVHRDLKPENILLATRTGNDRNLIKLADFGLSKSIGESMRTYVGTPQYLPPELVRVKNNPHAEHYTPVVDMWSAGVIIFVTLCGYPPFSEDWRDHSMEQQILRHDTLSSRMKRPIWQTALSKQAGEFVRGLIKHDVKTRLSASKALKHAWLNGTAMADAERAAVEHLINTNQRQPRTLTRNYNGDVDRTADHYSAVDDAFGDSMVETELAASINCQQLPASKTNGGQYPLQKRSAAIDLPLPQLAVAAPASVESMTGSSSNSGMDVRTSVTVDDAEMEDVANRENDSGDEMYASPVKRRRIV